MAEERQVDVAIIGGGTAGMAAYRKAAAQTDSVLLIEGDAFGTTCARVGCMPSKLLIAAANAAEAGRSASTFGISFSEPRIDGAAVMGRLHHWRDHYVSEVRKSVQEWPEQHRIMATARFTGPDTLALEPNDGGATQTVRAAQIIIATGASPRMSDTFAALGAAAVTSDDVFHWTDLPSSVLVFGAGVIGLEIGQALHRLGVRTQLLGKNGSIAQLSDPDVVDCAHETLRDALPYHTDHEIEVLERRDTGVFARWSSPEGGGEGTFERVLVAVGRTPNVEDLGLGQTGLELDDHGVPLSDPQTGRCGESNIWIAGDAADDLPLLHVAADRGKTAGHNAAATDIRRSTPSEPLSITFCEPQIAVVGRSHADLVEQGVSFETGTVDWSEQGRATVMNMASGLTHIYGEHETGRLLGAEMFGPAAEHLAHLIAWQIEAGACVNDPLALPFYHPCYEEGLRTALRKLADALGMAKEEPVPGCLDCGPGC
ncbi:dihydrolipoyl dehydrogenase [Roseobacter sp. HKCCA0434]|uniref:dihydrolipoyl dehydrogenase n=1 Tax=Roseobacter sp. HKCCA0434 TaxID=3079297 RepID=UPI002905A817|nr:dihydrolipoyl dehydrogenase [Roseobacter sp. HKCCA0434]